MAVITYRISRFGTVLLTPEQQLSQYLNIRVSCVVRRALEYPNRRHIPPQNNWLYWNALDADFFVAYSGYAQWYKQSWLLWEYPDSNTIQNICRVGNDLYMQIMGELAKKPNIPPLPPTVAPTVPPFSTSPRIQVPTIKYLTFFAFNDGDFDVTINWGPSSSPGQCSPTPLEQEAPAPIATQLPPPAPNMPAPPPSEGIQPGVLPSGSPPVGGTSLIPPGFPPGYQSSPPNARLFSWRVGRTGQSYVSTCSPSGGNRVPAWPTPAGSFPPVFYGPLVSQENLLGVASARTSTGSGCTTPGGRVLGGYQFLLNGVVVDANDAMQTYQLANYKIYADNGEWELVRIQASGSQ